MSFSKQVAITAVGDTDVTAAAGIPVNVVANAGTASALGHGTAAAAQRVELPTDGTGVVGLNAGSNIIGKVGIDQTTPGTTNAVQDIAGTAGGCTPYSFIAAAGTNQDSQVVKASAGQLYGSIYVSSINAAVRYLKIYDKATGPTSADTPKYRIPIPGAAAGAGVVFNLPSTGAVFAAGISLRFTTGSADNDANAVTASEHIVNLSYK